MIQIARSLDWRQHARIFFDAGYAFKRGLQSTHRLLGKHQAGLGESKGDVEQIHVEPLVLGSQLFGKLVTNGRYGAAKTGRLGSSDGLACEERLIAASR